MTEDLRTRAGRPRRSDGERTYAAILDAATRLASVEGVHGLTIGRLADAVGVSKSGLYAHFASKEQLQLETIGAAQRIFAAEVMVPVERAPEGIARLEALVAAYFSYLERGVFPGGCFFASLLAEADARTGPVHDAVVALERRWLEELEAMVEEAVERRELAAGTAAEELAFELYACFELSNYHHVLFDEPAVLERGRRTAARILERAQSG